MVRVVPLHVGQTALGTGVTTDAVIGGADYPLPAWAKSIMAMTVGVVADLPTAAESVLARTNVTSSSLPIQPMECFAAPLGSILGASGGAQFAGHTTMYDVNLLTNGLEPITFNMRDLVASTGANYGSVVIVVSDAIPAAPQLHYKAGTLTQGLTVNSEMNGTQFGITGAHNIVELLGIMGGTTQASSEGMIARMRFNSNEFAGLQNADLMMNPIGAGLGTLQISMIDGVSRQKCYVPIQNFSQANIQDSLRILSSANIGANVSFCSAVAYN